MFFKNGKLMRRPMLVVLSLLFVLAITDIGRSQLGYYDGVSYEAPFVWGSTSYDFEGYPEYPVYDFEGYPEYPVYEAPFVWGSTSYDFEGYPEYPVYDFEGYPEYPVYEAPFVWGSTSYDFEGYPEYPVQAPYPYLYNGLTSSRYDQYDQHDPNTCPDCIAEASVLNTNGRRTGRRMGARGPSKKFLPHETGAGGGGGFPFRGWGNDAGVKAGNAAGDMDTTRKIIRSLRERKKIVRPPRSRPTPTPRPGPTPTLKANPSIRNIDRIDENRNR